MAATNTDTAKRKPVGQNVSETRRVARLRRHARLRKKVSGTAQTPRLVVNRSARHIHVQLVDDGDGVTLAAAHALFLAPRIAEGRLPPEEFQPFTSRRFDVPAVAA